MPWSDPGHGSILDGVAHPREFTVPRTTDMEELLACLAPVHPRLSADTQRTEGLHTEGFPFPPLPGAPADGLQIPVASDHMEHDAREGQRNGDHPSGVTVNGLDEGGDSRASARHHCPYHCKPCQLYAGKEEGDKYKTHPPTHPSTTSKTGGTGASAVPAASPGPTARTSKAGSNARRAMGSGPKDPPPSV